MDSLVANYASSDEEEEEPRQQQQQKQSTTKASSFFSSLLPPKSSSLISSLPEPQKNPITKTQIQDESTFKSNKSSIFSSLPQPKSQASEQPAKSTKRVVKFLRPSIKSNEFDHEDDDEDDKEEKQRKKRKESEYLNQDSSVKSFLSSIPAPKSSATLGILQSNQGSGRRSIIETEALPSTSSAFGAKNESSTDQNEVNFASYELGSDQNTVGYANYYQSAENYASHEVGTGQNVLDYANQYQNVENYANHEMDSDQNAVNYMNYGCYESGIDQNVHSIDGSNYVNYGNYNGCGDYGQYGSSATVQDTGGMGGSRPRITGKRGKNEIPTEIVEVKQDELMKDRPREDQVKLTGIAFGPSYQPVSTKGKPSKLQKRKHQIGSLYFDMKQKEMELAERRSRGLLTKAQTQGKYGW